MRVFVKICCAGAAGQTYAIPCNEPGASVGFLKVQALERWRDSSNKKSKKGSGGEEKKAEEFQLTLSGNGALLSDKDVIRDVLRDGEFVNLCKRTCEHVWSCSTIIASLFFWFTIL